MYIKFHYIYFEYSVLQENRDISERSPFIANCGENVLACGSMSVVFSLLVIKRHFLCETWTHKELCFLKEK